MSSYRIELPELFSGEDGQDFRQWVKRFECAVATIPDVKKEQILPSRLSGSAFTIWDSLPSDQKLDFDVVKQALLSVFGQATYLSNFRSCISARTRMPDEPLEVYAAALSTLVAEAFPKYDAEAQDGEKFRRFMAGLNTNLRHKLYEMGASDFKSALEIGSRIEMADKLTPQMQITQAVAATSANQDDKIKTLEDKLSALFVRLDSFDKKLTDRNERTDRSSDRARSPSRHSSDHPYYRREHRSPSPAGRQARYDRYEERAYQSRSSYPDRRRDSSPFRSDRPSSYNQRRSGDRYKSPPRYSSDSSSGRYTSPSRYSSADTSRRYSSPSRYSSDYTSGHNSSPRRFSSPSRYSENFAERRHSSPLGRDRRPKSPPPRHVRFSNSHNQENY